MKNVLKISFIISLLVFSCNNEELVEYDSIDNLRERPEKITICHYEAVTDTWKQMSVHPNALDNHLAHGDTYDEYCPDFRIDEDNDGVTNDLDQCQETPIDETANQEGCSSSQLGYITELTEVNAWKWFGGDDRISFGPRNIGTGQSIILNRNYLMNTFSVKFSRQFDYSQNPEGIGHEVVVSLHLRDSEGVIISQTQETIESSFIGGWVSFDFSSPQLLNEFNTYIFTWYLNGGYDNDLVTGSSGNNSSVYDLGTGYYSSSNLETTTQADDFNNWGIHPWDFCFILGGEYVD